MAKDLDRTYCSNTECPDYRKCKDSVASLEGLNCLHWEAKFYKWKEGVCRQRKPTKEEAGN